MREEAAEAAASAAASRRTTEDGVAITWTVGDVIDVLGGGGVAAATATVSGLIELGEFVGHMVGSAVNDAAVELSSA